MAKSLDALFSDYAEHHRSAGNQYSHMIGIPLIAFGLFGLLSVELFRVAGWPPFAEATEGWPIEIAPLLILLLLPVQLRLDAKLGAALTVLYLAFYAGARLLAWQINLGLFVAGWIFQFIGHSFYEHRSPAFFTNLVHLFVGPLWILNHVLRLRAVTRDW